MQTVRKEILSYLKVLALGLIFAFVIKHYLFAPYIVEGQSMQPNLQEQNKLVVNKLSQFTDFNRFDIIVFNAPDADARYVKRVIGLPGDTVRMKDDVLYVNGKAYKESYLNKSEGYGALPYTGDFTLEELTGYKKVPKGSVFVLGDNRTISKDSRYFGMLPKENIIGKAVLRIWPFTEVGQVE